MKYLIPFLLVPVLAFGQTTIKPLTQDNIESAITDDAGFRTAIGAPATGDVPTTAGDVGALPATLTGASAPVDNVTDATAVGQRYRAGATAPYTWYRAITAGAGTSTWEEDGGGGTVDNDAVNDAIAEDPLATRESMGALERNSNLRGFKNSITALTNSGNVPLSAILIGDSFAATGSLYAFSYVTRVVGAYRSGSLTSGGDSGVTNINDYTKSPSGTYQRIADGGNLTAGHLQTGQQGPANYAYYTFFNGTGTAQMQYKKGGGSWTSVGSPINTTSITSVQIGKIALPDAGASYAVRVTATGGTVNGWIGQGLDGPGLTIIDFATAGHGIEQVATIDETIWKAMVTNYQESSGTHSQMLICTFADYRFTTVATPAWPTTAVPAWSATSPAQTLHDWSRTANASIDWLVIGPHQVNPANTDPVDAALDSAFSGIGIGSGVNDRIKDGARAQREFAVRNSSAWADCVYLTDYATGNAEGLYGDSIHFNTKGQDYKRAHVFNETNLGWILGSGQQHTALRIGPVRLSSTGARSVNPSLIAYVSGSPDATLAPITGASFRSPDNTTPEQVGMEFAWISSSLARIRNYNASGAGASGIDFGYNGGGPVIKPSATASSQCGNYTTPFAEAASQRQWTKALSTGYNAITSTFPVSASSEWGQIHTLHVTSGTFNITLPLSFDTANDAYATKGREIVIVNNGAGTVTILTSDAGGGAMQKIDNATSYSLAAGAKVRLQSTGTLAAADYANWITLP